MRFFSLGDLVQSKTDGRVGMIIESRPSNDGMTSTHMKHIQDCYPEVYYVMFPNDSRSGPFNVTDLALKQCCDNLK